MATDVVDWRVKRFVDNDIRADWLTAEPRGRARAIPHVEGE